MLRYGSPHNSWAYRWCFTRKFPSVVSFSNSNHTCKYDTFSFWAGGFLASRRVSTNSHIPLFLPLFLTFSKVLPPGLAISYKEITATYGKKPQCMQVINYFPSGLLAFQEKNTYPPSCSSTGRQKYADSGDGATFALPVSRNRFPCIAQHDFKWREIHGRKIYQIIRPTVSKTLIRALIQLSEDNAPFEKPSLKILIF